MTIVSLFRSLHSTANSKQTRGCSKNSPGPGRSTHDHIVSVANGPTGVELPIVQCEGKMAGQALLGRGDPLVGVELLLRLLLLLLRVGESAITLSVWIGFRSRYSWLCWILVLGDGGAAIVDSLL
jgi:hypothetical protein